MTDFEWTGGDLPTFVTHLECGLVGDRYAADVVHGLSQAGRPLLVRYDLAGVAHQTEFTRRFQLRRRLKEVF